MDAKGVSGGLDEHVSDQIAALEESLARVDEVFGNLNAVDYHEITKSMTALEKAKYDLTNMYAINSLFWMYLRSFGEDPKNTSMKEELERIKKQMLRLSQIANKSKMPRIDKDAANRFVRHGLSKSVINKAGQKKPSASEGGDEDWEDEPMETDARNKARAKANNDDSNSRKRKRGNDEASSPSSSSEEESTTSISYDDDDYDDDDGESDS